MAQLISSIGIRLSLVVKNLPPNYPQDNLRRELDAYGTHIQSIELFYGGTMAMLKFTTEANWVSFATQIKQRNITVGDNILGAGFKNNS